MVLIRAARRLGQSVPREARCILVAGGALRLLFFFLGQNAGIDALTRIQLAGEWLGHPDFRLLFAMWFPVHFWLIAGMSLLVGNVALAARLLSLLLGIASLGVFWALAKEIYGAPAARLSLLIFALYSLHVGYSITSCSEVPYLFMVLTGLVGFFAYRRSGSRRALVLGAIALGIGAGIRYEAWLFILAAGLILLLLPSQPSSGGVRGAAWLTDFTLFGGIAGLWPAVFMVYQWKLYRMPLYGVTMNYQWVAEQVAAAHRSPLYRLALFPGVLFLTLTPVIVAAGLWGVASGLRRRPGRDFAIICLIVGLATAYQDVAGGLLPLARYTITVGTLLAVAAGYGVEQFAGFLSEQNALRLRQAVGCLVILNLAAIFALSVIPNRFNDKFRSISPDLRFRNRIESVCRYLKPRLGPHPSLVIDDYNTEAISIAHVLGFPLLDHPGAYLASPDGLPGLLAYMQKNQPRYLIYSDRGILRAVLRLPGPCRAATVAGMKFQCLFENDTYRVYGVSYEESPVISAVRCR